MFQVTYPDADRVRVGVRCFRGGSEPAEVSIALPAAEAQLLARAGDAAADVLVTRGIPPAAAGHLVGYLGEIAEALEGYRRSGVRPGMVAFGRGSDY